MTHPGRVAVGTAVTRRPPDRSVPSRGQTSTRTGAQLLTLWISPVPCLLL